MKISKDRLKEIIRQEIMNLELKESIDIEEKLNGYRLSGEDPKKPRSTIDTSDGALVAKGMETATERIPDLKRGLERTDNPMEVSDAIEQLLTAITMANKKRPIEGGDMSVLKTAAMNALKQLDRKAGGQPQGEE